MQPESAVLTDVDRRIDRKRFCVAVMVKPKRPDQAGKHAIIRSRADDLHRISRHRQSQQHKT
jgi:hypothetical protein